MHSQFQNIYFLNFKELNDILLMRPLLLFCCSFLFVSFTTAQSFSFAPDDDYYGTAILENYNIFQIDIVNETADSLQLSWKFLTATTPEEWEVSLCDNMNCFGYIPDNGIMNPILDDDAFIKLDVNPGLIDGEGILTFLIFETNDQSVSHEIRFHISTIQVANENIPQISVEIFPNPATDFINIENSENRDLVVNISNANGKQIHQSLLLAGELKKIETNELSNGFYFLSLINDKKIISTEKIIVSK